MTDASPPLATATSDRDDPRVLEEGATGALVRRLLANFDAVGAPPFSAPRVVSQILPFDEMASNDLSAAVTLLRSFEALADHRAARRSPMPPAAPRPRTRRPLALSRGTVLDPRGGVAIYVGDLNDFFGRPPPPPEVEADRRKRFDNLPKRKGHGEDCAICLEKIKQDEDATVLLCTHSYHTECAWSWIKGNSTCPQCRFETL